MNLSLVYPKIKENYKAISAANDAIAIDPENEKAFFRRGTARMAGNDLELAISDFKKVVEINKVSLLHFFYLQIQFFRKTKLQAKTSKSAPIVARSKKKMKRKNTPESFSAKPIC